MGNRSHGSAIARVRHAHAASIMETGRLLRPVAYVSQRARRHMRVSAPTPIPDIRLAAPDCRNRRGTAGAVQAACTSRCMPDRQAGGPL